MNGIQVWIARFANVIGPKMTHGVIVDFVNKLKMNSNELLVLGDGLAKKPYVYVSDIINAIQKFVTESNTQYNTIVIGNNSVTEVYKIAEMVITAMGVDAVIKHTASSNSWKGDVKEYSCAPTIINGVEFKCLYNSDDAVKQLSLIHISEPTRP